MDQAEHQKNLEMPNLVSECLSIVMFQYTFFVIQLIFMMVIVIMQGYMIATAYLISVTLQCGVILLFKQLPKTMLDHHHQQINLNAKEFTTQYQKAHQPNVLQSLIHAHQKHYHQSLKVHHTYELKTTMLSLISLCFQVWLIHWSLITEQNNITALILTSRALMQSTQRHMQSWSAHCEKYLRLKTLWPNTPKNTTFNTNPIYSLQIIFPNNHYYHLKTPGLYDLSSWSMIDIDALCASFRGVKHSHQPTLIINHQTTDEVFKHIHIQTHKLHTREYDTPWQPFDVYDNPDRMTDILNVLWLHPQQLTLTCQHYQQLSNQQSQLLHLAHILYQEPSVWLIDASCLSLPSEFQINIHNAIQQFCSNTMILMVNCPLLHPYSHCLLSPPNKTLETFSSN